MEDVYVLGSATHPASLSERALRLEEMVYHTSRGALDAAGVSRGQLDCVTIGSCDELDGRPISSMLMAGAAGSHMTDETKVTDSGATALCLAFARIASGECDLGMVASWCKSSKTDVEAVMRSRGDPFFTRPLGMNGTVADGLFAQAVAHRFGISEVEVNERVVAAYARASKNTRGVQHGVPTISEVANSEFSATPLRAAQCAQLTDGAVSMVLASREFLRANPQCTPMARIAGLGWSTDSYRLEGERLASMGSARKAWDSAMKMANLTSTDEIDVVELESPTGWHEAAYARLFRIDRAEVVSPSGGCFAQHPLFCSGLVNAAEAVLQVAGRAGPVQKPCVRRAVSHSCHGYAQQGNTVFVFEAMEALP